jgi:outer membrane protein OmpA-like peptidoglycan-associated protein
VAAVTAGVPALPPGPGADVAWVDPEPAGAHQQAVEAVGAEWNRDKTTGLTMRILPLVDRLSGVEGFAQPIEASSRGIDQRLADLGAKVSGTEVTIRLPGSVLFDFDSAEIRSDADRVLGEVAEVLVAWSERAVRIEGHTDSIASDDYNLALSARRAEAVRRWLAAAGVADQRLSTAGLGETRPVADNATASGRQLNRRVEIVISG